MTFDFEAYDPACHNDTGCGFTPCECQPDIHPTLEQALAEIERLEAAYLDLLTSHREAVARLTLIAAL